MIVKLAPCGLALLLSVALLAGCRAPTPRATPVHAASPPALPADMEARCKDNVSWRYNTDAQQVSVTEVESWQGSYELRGYTDRQERFTCSFDTDGSFMHLSMR